MDKPICLMQLFKAQKIVLFTCLQRSMLYHSHNKEVL